MPANAKGRYNLVLSDVACTSPGHCVATGSLDSNTVSRGLLYAENGGAWSVSEPPLPESLGPGNTSVTVSSVACPAVGHCVAVGYATSGSQLVPLVFTQRPRGWQETVPPLPAGIKGGTLDLVSCPSIDGCTAAGTYLLDETEGQWTAAAASLPPNGSSSTNGATPTIQDLSCWAAGDCAAVGTYGDTHGSPQGWLLTETHGTWAQGVEAQLPANASTREGVYLYPVIGVGPVSCAPNGDCTAVGGYVDAQAHQLGMVLSEHAGRWGPAEQTPLPANAGPNPQQSNAPSSPLGSIACPSAGDCSAGGWYRDQQGNYRGLLLDEGEGSWSPSTLVLPSGGQTVPGVSQPGISLDSLACPSAGNCLAVGLYNPRPGTDRPLLVAERGGGWSKGSEAPPPAGAGNKYTGNLSSVSCPSAASCVAVGGYTSTAGFPYSRGLIVTIRRG